MDDFFKVPQFSNAALSPNGQFLALMQSGHPSMVTVTDLKAHRSVPIFSLVVKGAPPDALSLNWLSWKGDNRLILGLTLLDITRYGGRPDGEIVGFKYGRFMVAVDRDGGGSVQLLKGDFWNSERGGLVSLLDPLRNDPDHVLAVAPRGGGRPAVWKVDIKTGAAQMVEASDGDTAGWDTDSTGAIVARYEVYGRTLEIQGRAPGQTNWSRIVRLRQKDLKELPDFQMLGPTNKPGQMYVAIRPRDKSEGDSRTLRIYDFATKAMSEPVWPRIKYDIDNIVYRDDSYDLSGVCYTVDIYVCEFKDPVTTANFRAISKFFDNGRNVTPISVTDDARWWLFSVSGPDEPAGYYLFDWRDKVMTLLAERYPALPAAGLADMERWSFAARDGATVPAYLTRPKGAPKAPMPLIVLPHGGPEARDSLNFDTFGQFFATRGYLVFQPNFRGSGGYGDTYAEAGYRQWDGRMADDITDGVNALIKSGQADPARICIFGASYGGYAALFAGATHPELYKCVVSWAGIADQRAFLNYQSSFGRDSPRYQYWVKSIGDPATDKAALIKASPVTYAATYRPPVLLIHGDEDETVPVEQSQLMLKALRAAGKDVRLSLFKGEDHNDWDTDHEKAGLAEAAAFIAAHIAPAQTGPVPVAPTAAQPSPAAKKPAGPGD